MAKRSRLGEILIGERLVSRAQVDDALASQVVTGSRLGTLLVQEGLVTVDDIGRCLSVQHGVPHADGEMFASMQADAVAAVPKLICIQHKVLPLRFEGGDLWMAVIDPLPIVCDVLSYAVGFPLRVCVAAELRLFYHLEQVYGLEREARFLRTPDGRSPSGGELPPHERRRHLRATIEPPEGAAHPRRQRTLEGIGFGGAETPSAPTRRARSIAERLDAADSGAAIAELLVEPVFDEAVLSLLFWVRGDFLVAICARGTSLEPSDVRRVVVSLEQPSLFQWAIEMQGAVIADSDADAIHAELARHLNAPDPGQVCVAPVVLGEKVVNVLCLYCGAGGRFDPSAIDDIRLISEQAALAYKRLGERLR